MSDPILSMFNNVFYVVDLNPVTWVNRIEQGCLTLERFFPGDPLIVDMNSERLIKNRRKHLQSRLKNQRREFGFTNGRRFNGGDIQATGYIDIRGYTYPNGLIYYLSAAIPATTLEQAENAFATLADAVGAYCSQVKPYKACRQLQGYNQLLYERMKQLSPQGPEHVRPEGEKLLSRVEKLGLRLPLVNKYPATPHLHPAQPWELGWLNYWSAETCEYLGFPDPERDRDLLALSYQTPGGAWLVKICPDPLDLDQPDHLTLFAELYQRFPKLGLREGTVEPPPPFRYPEHTAYIHESNPQHIAERLVRVLQARGYQTVENLPNKAEREGVTVGLIQGDEEWTLLKTIPEEFLVEPLPGREDPLLVELCRELQCGGFVLNVHSEFEAVLFESDGTGRMSRSGIKNFDELPEDVDFEAMDESGHSPLLEFRLLDLDIETGVGDFDDYGQIAGQLHELLAGNNANLCADKEFAAAVNSQWWQERQGVKLCFTREHS
jgi:hypothetical protein